MIASIAEVNAAPSFAVRRSFEVDVEPCARWQVQRSTALEISFVDARSPFLILGARDFGDL
ncbi:hypothetical protein ACVWZW_004410 [Bradyrhizobium sp. F1.13.4]